MICICIYIICICVYVYTYIYILYIDVSAHICLFFEYASTYINMMLWRAGYTPADRLTSWGVLYHPCTAPVYKLLFISQ